MPIKLKLFIGFILLSLNLDVNAQITFEKTFGSQFGEEAKSVRQTPDGGYIVGGTNLVKLDAQGIEEWSKPYPSNYANLTSDNGYILVRSSSPDIYFTKVNANGDTLWQNRQRDGVWANEAYYIQETRDGGFIVTGRYQSVTGSGMLLLKLNSSGNKVWRRAYSESTSAGFNTGYAVQQTSDEGYILVGNSKIDYYDSTRNEDVFILKTDSVGTEQWRRFFGGAKDDVGYAVRQDADDNYIIAGRTNSYVTGFGSDMYLIKLDSNGDSLWTKTYGGDFMETATGLWITTDNGYILSGSTNTFSNGDFDGYVVKTDNNGDTLWTKNYGRIGIDGTTSVQQTTDKGFVFAGYTNSIGAGNMDMWVLKTDSVGNIQNPNSVSESVNSNNEITVYPNPSNGIVTFKSESKYSTLTVFNVLGKVLYHSNVESNLVTIDLSQYPKGVYFYRYEMENSSILKSGKLVLE